MSSIKNLVHELPKELPNNLRLRILGNIRKMSNVGVDAAQPPVTPPETKCRQQPPKNTQNQTLYPRSPPTPPHPSTQRQMYRPGLQQHPTCTCRKILNVYELNIFNITNDTKIHTKYISFEIQKTLLFASNAILTTKLSKTYS